jgi:hypothetical protein
MEEPFDQLSKALAEGMQRREALRRAGGLLLGAMAASLGLERFAWGQSDYCTSLCQGLSGRKRTQCRRDCANCEGRDRQECFAGHHHALICCAAGATCCGGTSGQCCAPSELCCPGTGSLDYVGHCCKGKKPDCCHSPFGAPFCTNTKTDPRCCGGTLHQDCTTLPDANGTCCNGECCKNGEECCTSKTGGQFCVNTRTDYRHCKHCNHQCRDDEICKGGDCLRVTCPAETPFVCRGTAANNGEYECCVRKEDCGNGACAKVCPSDAGVKPCPDANGVVTDCCEPNQVCANGKCEDECLPGLTVCLNENGVAEGCCKPGEICTLGSCVTCPQDWTFCGTPSSITTTRYVIHF